MINPLVPFAIKGAIWYQDVGDRLGRAALRQTYGLKGFAWSGPVAESCTFRFGGGHTCDLGVGSSEGKTRDWTFTSSGKDVSQAQFLVPVLP